MANTQQLSRASCHEMACVECASLEAYGRRASLFPNTISSSAHFMGQLLMIECSNLHYCTLIRWYQHLASNRDYTSHVSKVLKGDNCVYLGDVPWVHILDGRRSDSPRSSCLDTIPSPCTAPISSSCSSPTFAYGARNRIAVSEPNPSYIIGKNLAKRHPRR